MSSNYEFWGTVPLIRDMEDCIRASRKYTEGVRTVRRQHPIQGEDFPSRKLCKLYEVYPEMEVSMNMGAGDAIDLFLWGDTPCINVTFNYDYRVGKASMSVESKTGMLEMLLAGIPGLCDKLSPEMTANGHKDIVSGMIARAKREAEKARVETEAAKVANIAPPAPEKRTGWIDRLLDAVTPRSRR